MRKGAQVYTVRAFLTDKAQCRESYRKIAGMGYDSVQTWPPAFMTPKELQEMLEEFNLVNCSSGAGYEKLLEGGAAVAEAAKTARIFNTKYVTVGTLPEELRYSRDGYKRYAASLNKIAADLKKEGCVLLYHHHALEFYSLGGGETGMDILTGETDPEGVHFTFDTHWLVAAGVDAADWIRKVKNRMTIIHFKDYAITSGAEYIEGVCKTFAEVGEGNIHWPAVVEACRYTGVEYVIVEQDTCKGDPFDSLKISFDNMVRLGV